MSLCRSSFFVVRLPSFCCSFYPKTDEENLIIVGVTLVDIEEEEDPIADDEPLLDEPKSMITKPALDDEFSMELDGEIREVTEDAPNPRTIGKLDDDLCEEEI